MIDKIEILQHGEGLNLSSHFCEEAIRFLCIVLALQASFGRAAYHYELNWEKTVSILFLKRL